MKTLKTVAQAKDEKIGSANQKGQKLKATSSDVQKMVKQAAPVKSGLDDVDEMLNQAKRKIAGTAEKATQQDVTDLNQQVDSVQQHKSEVGQIQQKQQQQRAQAEAVKPEDQRILDGREMVKALDNADKRLGEIAQEEAVQIAKSRRVMEEERASILSNLAKLS